MIVRKLAGGDLRRWRIMHLLLASVNGLMHKNNI
jgi:hypothetical protein